MFFLVKVGECDYIGLEMAKYSEFVKKTGFTLRILVFMLFGVFCYRKYKYLYKFKQQSNAPTHNFVFFFVDERQKCVWLKNTVTTHWQCVYYHATASPITLALLDDGRARRWCVDSGRIEGPAMHAASLIWSSSSGGWCVCCGYSRLSRTNVGLCWDVDGIGW